MSDEYNAIADRALPGLRRAVLGILNGYAVVRPEDIEGRVAGGYSPSSIVDLVRFDTTYNAGLLYQQLASIVLKSMNAEANNIGDVLTLNNLSRNDRTLNFDEGNSKHFADAFATINAETVAFLERYALSLVAGLEGDVREVVRAILIRGAQEGWPVRLQAKAIAEAIGLNPRQEMALWNIQRSRYNAAIEAGRTITQAEAAASKAMEQARKRMITYRATTIARTEVIRAQNAGQQAVWEQYQQEGLLPMNATKVWIVTPDDRLCKRCRPLDGQEAPVRGEFDTDVGGLGYPPLHSNCRCATGIGRA